MPDDRLTCNCLDWLTDDFDYKHQDWWQQTTDHHVNDNIENVSSFIIAEVHAAEISEDSDDESDSDDNEIDSDADDGSATARSAGPIIAPPPPPSGNQGKWMEIITRDYTKPIIYPKLYLYNEQKFVTTKAF